MKKKPVLVVLTAGMEFESPWMGKGKIVSFFSDPNFGRMVNIYWYRMGIEQIHTADAIEHEVRLELRNLERKKRLTR